MSTATHGGRREGAVSPVYRGKHPDGSLHQLDGCYCGEPEVVNHGGWRKGAGRKPQGQVAKLYRLTERHVALLEQYRQRHGLASASEALRHMIEHACSYKAV